jgi:hypothetical protein
MALMAILPNVPSATNNRIIKYLYNTEKKGRLRDVTALFFVLSLSIELKAVPLQAIWY